MKSGDHISRAPLGARSWLDSRVILFESCVKITFYFFFVLLQKKPHNFPTAPTVKAIKVLIWTHRRSLRPTVDGSTHCSTLLSSSAARSGSAARTVECAPRVTTKEKKRRKKKEKRSQFTDILRADVVCRQKICRFLSKKRGFSCCRSPGSGGRLSHPFVGRWHRRFTGSGGGAIDGRRRCLSGCLVIYSERLVNFWWL